MAAISVPFGPRYLLPGILIIFSTSSAFRIHVRKCYEQSKTPCYQHPKHVELSWLGYSKAIHQIKREYNKNSCTTEAADSGHS